MRQLQVGIVGVGGMGSFHARTLAAFAGVEVVAVSDPHQPHARSMRDELGATIFADPFALIHDAEIDALVIASPDDTHAPLAIAAIGRGLPTLCEKPLATAAADARRVIDAETEWGRRVIQIGFMREFDPAHVQLLAELPDLGRIVSVRAIHRNAPSPSRPIEVIIGQSMVHDIHSVRWATGAEIESVHASTAMLDGAVRHVLVTCTLSNGGHAVLEFDDSGFAYHVGLEVVADHGDVLTGDPIRPVRRRHGSIDVHLGRDWFGWFADAYRIQNQAWIDSVREGAASGPSAWDGFVAQTVVDAILQSVESGLPARLDPPLRPALYA